MITEKQLSYLIYLLTDSMSYKQEVREMMMPRQKGIVDITQLEFEKWLQELGGSEAGDLIDAAKRQEWNTFKKLLTAYGYYK